MSLFNYDRGCGCQTEMEHHTEEMSSMMPLNPPMQPLTPSLLKATTTDDMHQMMLMQSQMMMQPYMMYPYMAMMSMMPTYNMMAMQPAYGMPIYQIPAHYHHLNQPSQVPQVPINTVHPQHHSHSMYPAQPSQHTMPPKKEDKSKWHGQTKPPKA